jgi:hypothetical protein
MKKQIYSNKKIGKSEIAIAWMLMLKDDGEPYFWNRKAHPELTAAMDAVWKSLVKSGVIV